MFDYQTSRSGRHARDFLDGWQGYLVVDDYAYKSLFTLAGNCTELGCWAHARRKFFDLHQASASTVAFEALQRIGKLSAIAMKFSAPRWYIFTPLFIVLTGGVVQESFSCLGTKGNSKFAAN